jgi:hypothetical protein
MGNVPELIYCAGKNRVFEGIALAAGYTLGARLPATIYHPIGFADQDWHEPDRGAYMLALAQHRPRMATVLDLEREEQRDDVLSWAEEASAYCERVLIIPKYSGAIDTLPRRINGADVVLAFSVPTKYGGTQVPLWEFAGWPVHLLGGSPHAQMHYAAQLNSIADVVSADGNMSNKMAHRCMFWNAKPGGAKQGRWWLLGDIGLAAFGEGSNQEAFRRSCINIREAWNTAF